MRFNRVLGSLIFLVMIFGLVACAGQVEPAQTELSAPTESPVTGDVQACLSQAGLPSAAEMDAMIQDKLMGHHDTNRILNAQHTREEWNTTLDRMIGYGANISESEKQAIIDYLLCTQR